MKIRFVVIWLVCLAAGPALAKSGDFREFRGCRLLPSEWADGDSFLVELEPGRQEVVRLYFVDCPETVSHNESDQRRMKGLNGKAFEELREYIEIKP